VFLFATFSYINPANWSPFIPGPHDGHTYGFSGVLRASTMVFFAYIGFDAVSTTAQEVKRPARDMPIGILGSLTICTLLYILVSLNLTGIAKYETLNSAAPLADAVQNLGMTWLKVLVTFGGVAGLSSVILVSLMAQPRIFYSMAHDGLLPPIFGKVHPKYGTPMFPTIFSGTVCAIAAGILPLDVLGDITSAGTLFAFAIVSASVTMLRFTKPDLERPFRVPLGPFVIPFIGAGSAITLIITTGGATMIRLAVWLLVGFRMYFLKFLKHFKALRLTVF
jgi:APA family basic amino acid/polyamine antiporter